MGDITPIQPPTELIIGWMGALVDFVARYDNADSALGYSMFYFVSDMYTRPNIRLISIDGVAPSRETIASDDYPLTTYYYAALRRDTPQDHPARAFLRWLLSDEGQKTAQKTGYVALKATGVKAENVMYPGATLENTTRSSGTGGTVSMGDSLGKYDWMSYFFSDGGTKRLEAHFTDKELNRIINEWIDGVYAATSDPEIRYNIYGDLCSFYSFELSFPDFPSPYYYHVSGVETAVFDMTTGKKLKLSDLFYDGVNYIKYINENMVDSAARVTWENTLDWNITDIDEEGML